MTKQAKGL